MPEIRVETTVDVDEWVDVEIEEILSDCSELEIEAAIRWLKDNDYITPDKIIHVNLSASEEQFYNNVEKLSKLYLAMSVEDSAVIESILNKY